LDAAAAKRGGDMPRPSDTIAALATPAGTAALAVIRISGEDTSRLAAALAGAPLPPRHARHLDYRALNGEVLDDVVMTFYAGPRSYTGEDALEIACHGNPFIALRILRDLLARGCRPANPGEFTQRAFLQGKLDLSQAEAVMDLIQARSERALAAANQQLRGALSRRMADITDRLLSVLARIEAYIDFPDEDLPPEDRAAVVGGLRQIILLVNELAATSRYGSLLRDGVKTVILGAPNAGKSSLLNRLVGSERALVSAEPGTTRDFIEERISIGPHLLRLIDTAGLNPHAGPIEKLGIAKTHERLEEADICLWVVDGSEPPTLLPTSLAQKLATDRTLVVINKADLPPAPHPAGLFAGFQVLPVSAMTGLGIEELRAAIVRIVDVSAGDPSDFVAINARHAQALDEAREWLASAETKLVHGDPIELVSSDLRAVLAAVGQITGRIDNERMLDHLFATFCIGK
jgi:tRNA modification GTPase